MAKTFSMGEIKDNLARDRGSYGSAEPRKFDAIEGFKQHLAKISNSAVIPLDEIEPDSEQPRKHISDEEFQDLVDDVKHHGVHTPITVRRNRHGQAPKFIIVCGERRFRAAKAVGLGDIPALILKRDLTEKELRVLQFSENEKRQGLNRIDEAMLFRNLLEQSQSMRQLARELGIGHDRISKTLKLLELSDDAQAAIISGRLPDDTALALLKIKDPTERSTQLDAVINGGATAADVKRVAESARKKTTQALPLKTNNTKTIDGLTIILKAPVRFTNAEKAARLRQYADKLEQSSKKHAA